MASPRRGVAGPAGTATGSPCRSVRLGGSEEFGELLLSLKRLVPDLSVQLCRRVADALLQRGGARMRVSSIRTAEPEPLQSIVSGIKIIRLRHSAGPSRAMTSFLRGLRERLCSAFTEGLQSGL